MMTLSPWTQTITDSQPPSLPVRPDEWEEWRCPTTTLFPHKANRIILLTSPSDLIWPWKPPHLPSYHLIFSLSFFGWPPIILQNLVRHIILLFEVFWSSVFGMPWLWSYIYFQFLVKNKRSVCIVIPMRKTDHIERSCLLSYDVFSKHSG